MGALGDGKIKAPPSVGVHVAVKVGEYQPSPPSACRLNR